MSRIADTLRTSALGRWFTGREPNEQVIIAALIFLIIFSLGWLLAWKPVSDWHASATNRLSNARETLDYVKVNQSTARQSKRQTGAAGGSLIPVLSRAANASGVQLSRLQPEDSGLLNVVLQGQPFDKVFEWMAQLERSNGVTIEQASFKSEERSGYVNAQIRFR